MPSRKTNFNTNTLPFNTTMIRQITKQHLTHINDVFWVHYNARDIVANSYVNLNFPSAGPSIRSIFRNDEGWRQGESILNTWMRQNIILSAASILEVYIISACTVVFFACPEMINRSLLGVNSVEFIKYPDRKPDGFRRVIKQRAEDPTKGTWRDRIKKLEMEIGKVPNAVSSRVQDLQDLQDKRNRIAHSYGAEGELRRAPWEPITAITATDEEILSIFKLVDLVSKSLDEKLFGPLIGGFEIINEYDSWFRSQSFVGAPPSVRKLAKDFKKHIGKAFGQAPGFTYTCDMIDYYDKI